MQPAIYQKPPAIVRQVKAEDYDSNLEQAINGGLGSRVYNKLILALKKRGIEENEFYTKNALKGFNVEGQSIKVYGKIEEGSFYEILNENEKQIEVGRLKKDNAHFIKYSWHSGAVDFYLKAKEHFSVYQETNEILPLKLAEKLSRAASEFNESYDTFHGGIEAELFYVKAKTMYKKGISDECKELSDKACELKPTERKYMRLNLKLQRQVYNNCKGFLEDPDTFSKEWMPAWVSISRKTREIYSKIRELEKRLE